MKIKLITILFAGLAISCNRPTNTNNSDTDTDTLTVDVSENPLAEQPKDTLLITDSDFSADPFSFGESPLKKLTSMENASSNFQVYENRHVKNQMDTLFQITIGTSQFEVYKAASKDWLTEARVMSNEFQTRQGINTGMTKDEVRKLLNIHSIENLPDYIRIEHAEVPEWMDFQFKDDRLEFIEFKGYVD